MLHICEVYINQLRQLAIKKKTFLKANVFTHHYDVSLIMKKKEIIYLTYVSKKSYKI
jgi:hypothetical protein